MGTSLGRRPGHRRRAHRHGAFGTALVAFGVAAAAVGLTQAALAQSAAAQPTSAGVHVQRVCGNPSRPGVMSCFALRRTDITSDAVSPDATPSGYGPSDLTSAYNLPSNGGAGQTIAIVDAYDDPNAATDLATYRSTYGLPALASGQFKKVNQNGQTSPLPSGNTGWAGEISLDLDMVSAIAPNANIILVEANSATDSALYTAEDTAVALGAKYVSNSWGGSESSGQTSDDAHFNHPGVAITVSAGDSAYGAEYPATSQYVTAVGGTSLSKASNSRGWSESVWKTNSTEGTGSGCSAYDPKPSWQNVTTGCTKRAEADVSAVADPATGVAVYQTYGGSGWAVYGGTSASSPIIAGVYALAGTPGASDYPAAYPYQHPSELNDVTSGNNGSCSPSELCTAGTGWDGPTGLGTPNGTSSFAASGGGGTGVSVTNPGSQSSAVGSSVSLQLSASGGTAPYTWSASGLPAGLSISSSGAITGTPTTAGTSSVTATATDAASQTGSVTFGWTVTSGGGGTCTAGQDIANPGFESGTANWTASTGVINTDGAYSRTGSGYAWLDGYGSAHTDSLSQTVSVPAGCSSVTFSFYVYISTNEVTTRYAYDTLAVKAGGSTLATYSNLDATSGYVQKSFTLSGAAGSSVTISFTGTEDSSLATSFLIDDTALNVS
jgi:putative Ig domain-containing protein